MPPDAAAALRALVGGRIERVRYWIAEDADEGASDDRAEAIDIDQGLVLFTSAGPLALAWCLDGYDEYLSATGDPGKSPAAPVGRLVDVSARPEWRPLIGAEILRVGAATIASQDGGDLLWAVRLEVDGAAGVTVALGETRGGAVEYSATNLVALFGRRAARAFTIGPGCPSAWGTDLPS